MKASPYIPKERLSAYERWEMASFDPVPPQPPARSRYRTPTWASLRSGANKRITMATRRD